MFVLVLLAAVFTSPTDEEPITANSIERQMSGGVAPANEPKAEEPKEPLAELGVPPGNADSNSSKGAASAE